MTTTYQRWLDRDPARRAPEVDFGTTWTSDRRPGQTWRVSWNTGSGELVAVTRTGDDLDVLGRFDSVDDVARALPHWAQQAQHPDGLAELRRDLAERERTVVNNPPSPPANDQPAAADYDPGWEEAERDYRQDMRDLANAWKEEERLPPRWHEYLATTDTPVEVDGRVEWRTLIDMDYDEWDRTSRHPAWPDYLASIPDDAVRAEPFEDWLATHEHQLAGEHDSTPRPVYGMVIEPDGSTSPLHEPVTADAAARHVGTDVLDVARVRPDVTGGRRDVMMWVDDLGHAKGLPVNPLATLLYGCGWPIVGTAVVFDDRDAVLPRSLSEGLSTEADPNDDVEPDAQRDPAGEVEIAGGEDHNLADWDLS